MSMRYTLLQYIQQAEAIHGKDKYDYTETVYINRNHEVYITCKEHGKFHLASARDHIQFKRGCPLCNRFNKFNEKIKEKYKEFNYTFSGSLYSKETYSVDDVIITCNIHNICFKSSTSALRERKNLVICDLCIEDKKRNELIKIAEKIKIAKPKKDPKNKLSLPEIIERVKKTYGEHNNCDDLTYINKNTPFYFKCTRHNQVCKSDLRSMQKAPNTIKCTGCRKERDIDKREETRKKEIVEYINASIIKYNNKYDYSLVKYSLYSEPVEIICPDHRKI